MHKFKNSVLYSLCVTALSVSFSLVSTFFVTPVLAQTTVVAIVNGNALTNYDIQSRVAFLKLQQKKGDLHTQAKNELIDEMLKNIEIERRNISVNDSEIDDAFENFAAQNRMTVDQFSELLVQADVAVEHFKAYLRGQIGWMRLVGARYQAEGSLLTEQEVVRRIKNGAVKPSTNEYTLQQIIFVVPAHRRSEILKKRQQEANNFRARFQGCDNTKNQAKGMLDVTVRNFGRILEPKLPREWEQSIRTTPVGHMTEPQETPNGIEAFAVCQVRKISDDRVAQLIFSIQDNRQNAFKKLEELSKKYLEELRAAARIQSS